MAIKPFRLSLVALLYNYMIYKPTEKKHDFNHIFRQRLYGDNFDFICFIPVLNALTDDI